MYEDTDAPRNHSRFRRYPKVCHAISSVRQVATSAQLVVLVLRPCCADRRASLNGDTSEDRRPVEASRCRRRMLYLPAFIQEYESRE